MSMSPKGCPWCRSVVRHNVAECEAAATLYARAIVADSVDDFDLAAALRRRARLIGPKVADPRAMTFILDATAAAR